MPRRPDPRRPDPKAIPRAELYRQVSEAVEYAQGKLTPEEVHETILQVLRLRPADVRELQGRITELENKVWSLENKQELQEREAGTVGYG